MLALAAALGGLGEGLAALAAALGEGLGVLAARSFNTVSPRISNASAQRLMFTVQAGAFRVSARACNVRA
jgi:hypothetical protein